MDMHGGSEAAHETTSIWPGQAAPCAALSLERENVLNYKFKLNSATEKDEEEGNNRESEEENVSVSDQCASTLHEAVAELWKGEGGLNEWDQRWEVALSRAYERVDDVCKDKSFLSVGSTALVVLVSPCQIIAAKCCDCRAILCRRTQIISLTKDHKPDREDEIKRIINGGSYVVNMHGIIRVEGVLAMTRAIGDHSLKPWVSSVPEVTFTTRTEEDECLILACDGLWDVMSTEKVGKIARKLLRQKRQEATAGESSSQSVANILLKKARSKLSSDNIAVIVICC